MWFYFELAVLIGILMVFPITMKKNTTITKFCDFNPLFMCIAIIIHFKNHRRSLKQILGRARLKEHFF